MYVAFLIINFILLHYLFFCKTNILQKQYYSFKRYILYLFDNKLLLCKSILSFCSVFLVFINVHFALLFFLSYFEPFKNKVIKFNLTSRVKRHFLVFETLNIACLLLIVFIELIPLYLTIIILHSIYWLSFVFSIFIEKIIQFHYIKKAKEKLKAYGTKIVAITGSFGKTSTKNYIYTLINNTYTTLATNKSFNTLNGILLTINKQLKPFHEVLILEIGVDEKGGMNKFIKHFNFDIGLITCIGNQHLKTFKKIENIAKEKTKLLYNCKECVVINKDDQYLTNLNFNVNQINCSTKMAVNVFASKITFNKIYISINNKEYTCNYNLLGKHNLNNLTLAVGVAKALNIDDSHIIDNIEKLKNVSHRLSISYYNNWTIIDDSYNSNINGFINALEELNQTNEFKVLITPGVIENKSANNKLIEKINNSCDLVLVTSKIKEFEKLKNKVFFDSFNNAFSYLKENYLDTKLTILIENDIPDIFLR